MSAAAPYTPDAGDIAIEMLREIFGPAITHLVGGSTSAAAAAAGNLLGAAFGYFNSGVLILGSIILTWVTVFGIANTANDGQVLGKKWSTFYTPLRTFTASGMLIPSASGYSVVQIFILIIVTWSVGFASNMWSRIVTDVINVSVTNQALRTVIDDQDIGQTALNALRMNVCATAVTNGVNGVMPAEGAIDMALRRRVNIHTVGDTTTYTTSLYFADPKFSGSENICGMLTISTTYKRPSSNSVATMTVASALEQEIGDLQGRIGGLRESAIKSMLLDSSSSIRQLVPVIQQAVENTNGSVSASLVSAALNTARDNLLADLRAEVSANVTRLNSDVAAKFTAGGWVMAGSLHRELARINDAIRHSMTTQVSFTPGTKSVRSLLPPGDVADVIEATLVKYNALIAELITKVTAADTTAQSPRDLPKLHTGFELEDFVNGGATMVTTIKSWTIRLPNHMVQGITSVIGETDRDPVMQVKDLGDYIAGFAETVYTVATAAKIAVKSVAKEAENNMLSKLFPAGILAVLTALAEFLTEFLSPFMPSGTGLFMLLYSGYFLGIWLPMVPFFIFGLGVVGWLIQVIEALAAGALWMVMHLTPESNDSFIGSQQQGYLLLMSLFARPPLMVLGLVASMVVLTPSVRYINAGFITAFNINQADSVTGLPSVAGYVLVYCIIMTGLFMLVFALPQSLPDRILRWIGAGIQDMGEQSTAGRIETTASSQARGAVAAAAARYAAQQTDRAETNRNRSPERATVGRADDPAKVAPEGF